MAAARSYGCRGLRGFAGCVWGGGATDVADFADGEVYFEPRKARKGTKEVLKFGSSKVLKFGLAPVPSRPAGVEPPRRQERQGEPRMGANGWCFFNRENRENRESFLVVAGAGD